MLGRTVFGVLARPCVVAVTITLFLFQHALAQTPTGAQLSSPGARVILLGTGGGPILRKGRSQPASLLVIDGAAYLIDAGDGVSRQMTLAEVPGTTLRAVFLTHLHLDHTAGLPSLIGSKNCEIIFPFLAIRYEAYSYYIYSYYYMSDDSDLLLYIFS